MPHFIVKLFPGKSDAQKKALTEKIVQATQETLEVAENVISVAFEEVAQDDWDGKVTQPDLIPKKDLLFKKPDYI
jgi:4-oxalocrotonate tautomerase